MDPREYELMYRVEESHWWYRGMESITRAILERWIDSKDRLNILDAGCGTGAAMMTYLADYGNVTGVDLYWEALTFCQKRKAHRLARASITDLPFVPASFDLVTSFDVLYERGVSDEIIALREFARVLTSHGRVLLRLPAYDWLRGKHDERVYTKRRYTHGLVKSLLQECGFRAEHISYANTWLFPLAVAKRLSEKISHSQEIESDLSLNAGILNEIFRWILSSEAPFVSHIGLPYGLSVIAIATKE